MRKLAIVTAFSLLAAGLAGAAEAKKRAKKKAPPKAAAPKSLSLGTMSKSNAKALEEFQGKFKWGLPRAEVIKLIGEQIKPIYDEKIAATKDVYTQDQLRRKFNAELKRLQDSFVDFKGQKTGWDVSIIDREFAHKNGESMIVWKKLDETRYYFFIDEKLWKQFIAFDAKKFGDKTFQDFRAVFEAQFGSSTPVERVTETGKIVIEEFAWPAAGKSMLRAVDKSKFHGNYCLSIADKDVQATIMARRKERNPEVKRTSTIVDSVTQPGTDNDPNNNVLDDIVGKKNTP